MTQIIKCMKKTNKECLSKPAPGFCAIFETEYEAVTWLCAKTKLWTSQIMLQNKSSSGTVLPCEMFRFLIQASKPLCQTSDHYLFVFLNLTYCYCTKVI